MANFNARPIAAGFCLLAANLMSAGAEAQQGREVDLSDWKSQYLEETYCAVQLVLLMDVSGSIDASEYDLQIKATANALISDRVKELILAQDAVCITAVQFSDDAAQVTPWTRILYENDLNTYAATISNLPRQLDNQGTDIYEGLTTAINVIQNSPYDKKGKMIIDVTGDGKDSMLGQINTLTSRFGASSVTQSQEFLKEQADNFGIDIPSLDIPNLGPQSGPSSYLLDTLQNINSYRDGISLDEVTARAEGLGIQINGVAILDTDTPDLESYYRANVITYNGFVVPANGWEDFESAIRRKLEREMIADGASAIPMQLRGPNRG